MFADCCFAGEFVAYYILVILTGSGGILCGDCYILFGTCLLLWSQEKRVATWKFSTPSDSSLFVWKKKNVIPMYPFGYYFLA